MEVSTRFEDEKENFVTVVSVGSDSNLSSPKCDSFSQTNSKSSGYVTVLTIGDSGEDYVAKNITEEVLVYRLPGERLGFGLKFEGGTKANEFVKRLFIQSCSPDSPASRVQSSWGKLTEGDEVLEIDSMPVNSMTRIDCVRCLKDSNVVIKLLVRHFNQDDTNNKSTEDLPQVISAEKKRTPPPPPPVPPRKIPKKFYRKNLHQNNGYENSPIPAARQINSENNSTKKFQSPRSSGRASHSPDIHRRDRRFSDGSGGPPDAEVYVDLFSQESTQSLSESDDTGSSISTVVDKFGSFPTTTTSSLAGSLPSTPTSIQKQIDFSNVLNSYEEEDFAISLNRSVIKQGNTSEKNSDEKDKIEEKTFAIAINEDGTPLQPPSCFQDAPLSYGNEDMRIIETKSNEIQMCDSSNIPEKKTNSKCATDDNYCNGEKNLPIVSPGDKLLKKPPVPPRSRDIINNKTNKDFQNMHDENMNISNLPRLVDFVPKSTSRENFENPVEIINMFLENERRDTDYLKNDYYPVDEIDTNIDVYNNGIDVYSSRWSLSSQLATIGEDEEEDSTNNRSIINSPPIVIIENADTDTNEQGDKLQIEPTEKGINGKMETLSSDSRQPPDGHEFPDYVEVIDNQIDNKFRENYRDLFNQQLTDNEKNAELVKTLKLPDVNWIQDKISFNNFSNVPIQNKSFFSKSTSASNSDLSSINSKDSYESGDEVLLRRASAESTLHTRSQSLIDMSTISKQRNDRWSSIVEQRRKGYSKLKGLVIPEHVSETETTPAVNIPEIISHTTPALILERKNNQDQIIEFQTNIKESVDVPLTAPPPWVSNSSTLPKYSPAFKRKTLQVYAQPKTSNKSEEVEPAINKSPVKTSDKSATLKNKSNEELRLDNLSDSPKSLESITSPTRSDCSFDYVSPVNKGKLNSKQEPNRSFSHLSKLHKELGKSEDESDNDSAVSSSQSSYISRCSPPPSPTRSCEMLDYESNVRAKSEIDSNSTQCRLLKPASVEAINRKNILASAKCRSGRDLKVGSPVIQRKYEDEDMSLNPTVSEPDNISKESESLPPSPKEKQNNHEDCNPNSEVNIDSKEQKIEEKIQPKSVNKPFESNLVKLKPVANSVSSFSSQLRETKVNPKNNFVKSNSLLKNNKSMSVTDLRKSFEKFGTAPPPLPQNVIVPNVTTKEPKSRNIKVETKSIKSIKKCKNELELPKVEKVSKPTTILLSKQINEHKDSVGNNRREIVLCPEFVGGSIGITLAGGVDYETKEITVHKIRYGSVAYNDGQLKKGDRIISINGKSTANLTHAESIELLKETVSRFVLVVEDGKDEVAVSSPQKKSSKSETPEPKSPGISVSERNVTHVVSLTKNGAGLGFSIEGGKDSPLGDLPLRIKKIFQGGLAEKSGKLYVGDELLAINDISLTNLSRLETWTLMKKLPDGEVNIHIHR